MAAGGSQHRSRTPVLVLEGTGLERGRAYGEQAGDLVVEFVERWTDNVVSKVGFSRTEYVEQIVGRTGFLATACSVVPDVVDELTGLAEVTGVDVATLIAINAMDEEWWLRSRLVSAPPGEHCSGVGVQPSSLRPAMAAQNMDLADWMHGLQVLLDIAPADGKPRAFVPTLAGMVALTAFNEAGIGVCCNTLTQLPTSDDGLPVAFVVRAIAGCVSLAQVEALLRGIRHASGQNYLVVSQERVADFECSADGVWEHARGADRITHTNHPLAVEFTAPVVGEGVSPSNSAVRLDFLDRSLADVSEPSVEALVGILRERPLCLVGSQDAGGQTIHTQVLVASQPPVLHLTAGNPDEYPLHRFEF